MSSNDECNVIKEAVSSSDSNSSNSFAITILSVTGQKWKQNITLLETIDTLKGRIWRRTGLFPYHQGLIFNNLSLSEMCGDTLLSEFGVQHNSLIRLAIVTRSGPLAVPISQKLSAVSCGSEAIQLIFLTSFYTTIISTGDWKRLRMFDEQNLDENRRTLFRMCELRRQIKHSGLARPVGYERQGFSAPEDTSAKESSAGDTECEEDKNCSCSNISSFFKSPETTSLSVSKFGNKKTRSNPVKEVEINGCGEESLKISTREQLLMMMHSRPLSPSTDVNTQSDGGSEFSSGMIVCDLSNEFRRLRVRRKHHGVSNGSTAVQRTRARSKPGANFSLCPHRQKGSDLTSSDDERPYRRAAEPMSCSAYRRSTVSRTQKVLVGYQSHQRCSACAIKLNNFSVAFQCRCGKTLCARHRSAEMHTCTRIRKLQDASD
ncbi:unnamed protein product [Thelazia callipaeda]|uniref:Ubiquitin-like domain-containing protein n=1 Tax=Thelazia callipaeda TaxID=103827 RepID=A0A0N5CKY9_THECL|nr:unnamed protein product [Thelazia callipaeda]